MLLAMGIVGVGMGMIRWGFASESAGVFLIIFGCLLIIEAPFAIFGYGIHQSPGKINAKIWFIFFVCIAMIAGTFVIWIKLFLFDI